MVKLNYKTEKNIRMTVHKTLLPNLVETISTQYLKKNCDKGAQKNL